MARVFVNVVLIVLMLRPSKGISSCSEQGFVLRTYRASIPNQQYCLSCAIFRKENIQLRQFLCIGSKYDLADQKKLFNSIRILRSYSPMELKITAGNFTTYKNDFSWRNNEIKKLDISENDIGIIPEAFFYSFPNLLYLDLSSNNLTSISVHDFRYLNGLQGLDLSFNRISNLTDAFEPILDLFDINLSHNKISNIPKNLFESQMHLENLKLSYNEMVRFEVEMPKYSKFILNELDLSFNKLENVSINKDVKRLIISRNNLTEFSLKLGENLVSLNLSHNRLVKIDDHSMLNAVNVADIDLSYNKLQSLPTGSFRNQQKLSSLNISNNLLAESSFGSYNNWATFFYNFAMLKSVDLNNNLWTCTELRNIIFMLLTRSVGVIQGNYHNSSNILGVKCTETFTNNTSLSNESRSDFSQDIAFDALVSELDNLLLKIKNLESQLNVTHAQINETILNQVAYLDLKTNQTEQDLTDLWTQMKANANQINNTISNIESFKSNISKAIKDANFNGEISATNINNLHEEVRNDLIKTVNNILPRLVNLEERIKTIGVEAHSEHTNKDGTFLRKTLSNSTGTFNEKPTDSNVATHLSGQDDTIKQAHESKEILEQIRDGTNAISGIVFQNLLLLSIFVALLYIIFNLFKRKKINADREELSLVQA
uniref:Uncharacterized protein n=1 Tax=Dendroctonus ponderosae TaxID=77166 RepID=A0AAR5P8A7_DENPD